MNVITGRKAGDGVSYWSYPRSLLTLMGVLHAMGDVLALCGLLSLDALRVSPGPLCLLIEDEENA
jgi:hypothetical protein